MSAPRELFGSLRDDPLVHPALPAGRRATPAKAGPERLAKPVFAASSGITVTDDDIRDQFLVFQFNEKDDGPRILESSRVEPKLEGSDERPDVAVRLKMAAFHVGQEIDIGRKTRATLRVDMGKDKNSNSVLPTLFWSIAAGLKLYNEVRGDRSQSRDLQSDFSAALSHRPIEVPGGLAQLSFEVVKHREPSWWQKIFTFLRSGTGVALTSAIGFPAITTQAIGLIDGLLNRLDRSSPQILFRSRPMTLALTQKARTEIGGGLPGIRPGALNSGYCLLARGRDYSTILDADPVFFPAYGILAPADVSDADLLAGRYDNPFENTTYAVFRLAMKETEIDIRF